MSIKKCKVCQHKIRCFSFAKEVTVAERKPWGVSQDGLPVPVFRCVTVPVWRRSIELTRYDNGDKPCYLELRASWTHATGHDIAEILPECPHCAAQDSVVKQAGWHVLHSEEVANTFPKTFAALVSHNTWRCMFDRLAAIYTGFVKHGTFARPGYKVSAPSGSWEPSWLHRFRLGLVPLQELRVTANPDQPGDLVLVPLCAPRFAARAQFIVHPSGPNSSLRHLYKLWLSGGAEQVIAALRPVDIGFAREDDKFAPLKHKAFEMLLSNLDLVMSDLHEQIAMVALAAL